MIEFRTDGKSEMLLLPAIAVVLGLNMALPTAKAASGDLHVAFNRNAVQATFVGVARFADTTSAGNADGTSWNNRWAYTPIPWGTVESLTANNPVYILGMAGLLLRFILLV